MGWMVDPARRIRGLEVRVPPSRTAWSRSIPLLPLLCSIWEPLILTTNCRDCLYSLRLQSGRSRHFLPLHTQPSSLRGPTLSATSCTVSSLPPKPFYVASPTRVASRYGEFNEERVQHDSVSFHRAKATLPKSIFRTAQEARS
jgi:hypothetical protein